MLPTLAYYLHDLNPVIIEYGPYIKARWYGFSYLLGFLAAYLLIRKLSKDGMLRMPHDKIPDLVLNCCIFGVLVGGRLGYCLFYQRSLLGFSAEFPYWGVFRVWEGGMSAHGGVLFTILTLAWFAWKHRREGVSFINIGDAACMVVPVGLCFGRIANFINGELYGHTSTVPWAVKFPSEIFAPTNNVRDISPDQLASLKTAVGQYVGAHWQNLSAREVQDFLNNHPELHKTITDAFGKPYLESAPQLNAIKQWIGNVLQHDPQTVGIWDIGRWWEHGNAALHEFLRHQFDTLLQPRHPSQLYEALLEGVALFLIVWTIGRLWRKDGMAGGAFLTFYPIMRIIGEQFRVGDTPQLILGVHVSLGIIYSLLMFVPGLAYWLYWIRRNRAAEWKPLAVAIGKPTKPSDDQTSSQKSS